MPKIKLDGHPADSHRPRPISTEPYTKKVIEGKPQVQRQLILDTLARSGALNRRLLGEATGIPINVICWRVKDMLTDQQIKVVEIRRDRGQRTEFLDINQDAPDPRQLKFPDIPNVY